LQQRGDGQQHHSVGASQQPRVQASGPYGLALRAHVTGHQHADYRQHADVWIAPGADGNRADHYDVGIAVKYVVQEVAPAGLFAGEPGDLAVKGIEKA